MKALVRSAYLPESSSPPPFPKDRDSREAGALLGWYGEMGAPPGRAPAPAPAPVLPTKPPHVFGDVVTAFSALISSTGSAF